MRRGLALVFGLWSVGILALGGLFCVFGAIASFRVVAYEYDGPDLAGPFFAGLLVAFLTVFLAILFAILMAALSHDGSTAQPSQELQDERFEGDRPRGWFDSGFVRLAVAVMVAAVFTVGATLVGGQIESGEAAACVDMTYPTCNAYETYQNYGWPVPWRTNGPPEAMPWAGVNWHRAGWGVNSHGIAPAALAMSLSLWFMVAFGGLLLVEVIVSGRWRRSALPARLIIVIALPL